jgi:thioredoxin 1
MFNYFIFNIWNYMNKKTIKNFDEISKTWVTIVKFGAEWCGPCKQLDSVLESRESDLLSKWINLVFVDVDESPELAQKLRIMSVPTTYFFKNWEMVKENPIVWTNPIGIIEVAERLAE